MIYDCGDWRDFRVVTGPVAFLGPQWHALFKHALAEAARLGIEVSMPDCSGWNCGGPWIKAEHACQKVIWSEKRVEGPAKFAERPAHAGAGGGQALPGDRGAGLSHVDARGRDRQSERRSGDRNAVVNGLSPRRRAERLMGIRAARGVTAR